MANLPVDQLRGAMGAAARKVEDFVRGNAKFQAAVEDAFNKVDVRGAGKVSLDHAAMAAVYFFEDLAVPLQEYGIRVQQPSVQEVKQILRDSDFGESDQLGRAQFEEFYAAVLKFAAVRAAAAFVRKYGLGMLLGVTSVMIVKRAVRALPVVGAAAGPVLGWFVPTFIFGPALGCAGVWCYDQGDLEGVRRKLFPERKGQFKSG